MLKRGIPNLTNPSIEVPPGFNLQSEKKTDILLPSDSCAFLNLVQGFNEI